MALLHRRFLICLECLLLCGGVFGDSHGSTWVVRRTSTDEGGTDVAPAEAFDGVATHNQWTSNTHLKLAKTMMGGDVFGVLGEMGTHPGLTELWSDPDTLSQILDVVPMLSAIKGIGAIARHREHRQLTAEDGGNALAHLQSFLSSTTHNLAAWSSPDTLAQKFHEYASTKDPELQELMQRAGQGDEDAVNQLRRRVADKEFGGMLDLDVLGHDGTEPEFMAKMRETLMAHEDDLFSLFHLNDPVAKRYMSNPNLAMSDARDIAQQASSSSEA